jgi:recombination protein RecR
MSVLPKALENLITELGQLPGVGPRTAERYAYHLLKSDQNKLSRLSDSIANIKSGIGYCSKTFCLVEAGVEISPLYSDPKRDKSIIAVVEDPFDVLALEKTANFTGTYHVLGGSLSPLDGITPEQLRIKELVDRVKEDDVKEVILATNSNVEGDTTALFVQKELSETGVRVTRLARGLPAGVDLEYADQITLTRALEGRQNL